MGKVSLVLPIYNEQVILREVLQKYIKDLENIRLKMQYDWEIVAVDDASTDESKLILMDFAKKNRNFRVVLLKDRYGKHAAVTAGFAAVTGDVVITAEIDLQNPLGLLETLLREHLESKVPIIYGYQQFTGWQRRKAIITDRLTRFASRLFMLDGYFTGIVNAELYAADVVDVLRQNPMKNKYMRTMNNWVGWESKELWYAREYTDLEAKAKKEQLRKRSRQVTPYKKPSYEASGARLYSYIFLFMTVVLFGFAIASASWAAPVFVGLLFIAAFASLLFTLLSFLRYLLMKRVGNLNFRSGEVIYEIKSILNK